MRTSNTLCKCRRLRSPQSGQPPPNTSTPSSELPQHRDASGQPRQAHYHAGHITRNNFLKYKVPQPRNFFNQFSSFALKAEHGHSIKQQTRQKTIFFFYCKQLCIAHHLKKELHLKVFPPIKTTKDTYSYTYQVVTAHNRCTIPPSFKCVRLKNLRKVTEKIKIKLLRSSHLRYPIDYINANSPINNEIFDGSFQTMNTLFTVLFRASWVMGVLWITG